MDRARRNGQRARESGHVCLRYRGLTDFLAGVGEFVLDGLASGAAVLVALPPGRLDPLRHSLDTLASGVEFVDMTAVGRNPGAILGVLHRFASGHEGPVRIVGEPIWAGRRSDATVEAIRHEALLNLAFTGTRVDILCPYEVTALGPDVLAAADRTHPTVLEQGRYLPSPRFADPVTVAATCDRVTLPEPVEARTLLVTTVTAGSLPARVVDFAVRRGATRRRAADLAGAVDEIVGLVLVAGRAIATVRLWRDQDHLVAEVTDPGPLTEPAPGSVTGSDPSTTREPSADPLAGRIPPAAETGPWERAMWQAHQRCDLVETRVTAQGRIHRLHLQVGIAAPRTRPH